MPVCTILPSSLTALVPSGLPSSEEPEPGVLAAPVNTPGVIHVKCWSKVIKNKTPEAIGWLWVQMSAHSELAT